jgi:hypothetical protein
MNYTVVWSTVAQNDLAQLWVTAPDRAAVTAAANRIDQLLRRDPHAQGESRFESSRILVEPPLAVYFRIDDPDCLVEVTDVWRI